jgi:hypothetical protein
MVRSGGSGFHDETALAVFLVGGEVDGKRQSLKVTGVPPKMAHTVWNPGFGRTECDERR